MFTLKLYIVLTLVISKENFVLNADNPTANVFDSFDDAIENNEPEASVSDAGEEYTTQSAILDTESTLEDDSTKTGYYVQESSDIVIENNGSFDVHKTNVPENIEENTPKSEMHITESMLKEHQGPPDNVIKNENNGSSDEHETKVPENIQENTPELEVHNTESTLEDNGYENNVSLEANDEERLNDTNEDGVNADRKECKNEDKSDEDANNLNLENNDTSQIATTVDTLEDKLVEYDDDKTSEEVDVPEKETSKEIEVTESFDVTKTEVSENQSLNTFYDYEQAIKNEDSFEEIKDNPQQTNDLHDVELVNQDSSEDDNDMILITNKSEDPGWTLDGPRIGSKIITSIYNHFLDFDYDLHFSAFMNLIFGLLLK